MPLWIGLFLSFCILTSCLLFNKCYWFLYMTSILYNLIEFCHFPFFIFDSFGLSVIQSDNQQKEFYLLYSNFWVFVFFFFFTLNFYSCVLAMSLNIKCNGDSGYPCLFPDCRRNASLFPLIKNATIEKTIFYPQFPPF